MEAAGESAELLQLRDIAPTRRIVARPRTVASTPPVQVPLLLALLPAGSLVVAGLLIVLLAWFVPTSPVPPDARPGVANPVEVGPAVDGTGDERIAHFQPMYVR